MGLLLQLLGLALLFIAGFELWRFLVGSISVLIVKLGLLRNIRVDPRTQLSVTLSAMKISLWTQVPKFLQSPTQEKLLILKFPSVHVVVVTEPSLDPQFKKQTPAPLWHNLDTETSLKDIRHPVWASVREWMPRLFNLCRCAHAVELAVDSLSVDVVEKKHDITTTVVCIQHESISISALFHADSEELVCSIKLSQAQRAKISLPELGVTTELGLIEVSIRVPISQTCEGMRSPIPSAYSVVCELIQVNLDFEHLLLSTLRQKQQKPLEFSSIVADIASDNPSSDGDLPVVELKTPQLQACFRLAELIPDNLYVAIRRLEVAIVDRDSTTDTNAKCSLFLNNFDLALRGASDQENDLVNTVTKTYSVINRGAILTLGPVVARVDEVDACHAGSGLLPTVKLETLKIELESALSISDRKSDDIDAHNDEEEDPSLCLRLSLSGGTRGLTVTIAKNIEPWVASCCLQYAKAAALMHGDESTQCLPPAYCASSILDFCEIDVEAHFKMVKTEITLISLDRTCEILPKGVPSISLTLGEISVYGHPFVNEEHLGVRAKADLQCSRVKASYFTNDSPTKIPFLSLDFVRVFVSPIMTMIQNEIPAEVEMEAEWVEVKWSPEVLHAIGGMIELGIFIVSSFLHESRHPVDNSSVKLDPNGWRAASSLKIPQMRNMADVTQDNVCPGEVIVFRCVAKRICVIFPYVYEGLRQVDCVTVDTFAMSSEGSTGRLRISILDARAFPSRRSSGEAPLFPSKTHQKQTPFRRSSFASRASRTRTVCSNGLSAGVVSEMSSDSNEYFVADCFSIEENKVTGSTKKIVDLFVNGARMEWDLSTQLRVTELIRRITFSSWEMIYRARSAYAVHCTPPDSIYNRPYGLNPPLDDVNECLRYEKLFANLISASGDTLHRLHATNISAHAKLCDGIEVFLSAGLFAGDDLPEIWIFEDVSFKVNELEMAAVGGVRVQHTVDKQADYVFGEFEEMLQKRLTACNYSTPALDHNLADGILIDVNRLHLCTSHDFPFQAYLDAVHTSFEPFEQQLTSIMSLYWRPQHDLFYQYFLRTPVVTHQKAVWMRLEDVRLECIGNPLESWLEQMYPVWIEELAEQELRAQMLDDHVATLKLANTDLLCDESYVEMKTLLAEKNAKLYAHKVKKLQALAHDPLTGANGPLMCVGVGHVNVDIAFEEDSATSWARIAELDEASETLKHGFQRAGRDWSLYTPRFLLFMGLQVKVVATELFVQMRRFPTPLLSCDCLKVEGYTFVVAHSHGSESSLPIDFTGAIRCFVDLSVDVTSPVLYCSPSYLYSLDELAGLAMGFLPFAVLDIDKRFQTSVVDIARRLLHGKVSVTVKDTAVRLLCAATSFELTDYLEIAVHRVRVAYACGSVDLDITRVTAKIEPGALSNIAELSHLKLQVWLKWNCLNEPAMHYTNPIEFRGLENTSAAGDHFLLQFPEIVTSPVAVTESSSGQPSYSTAGSPFRLYQAMDVSVFISVKICPVSPGDADPSNSAGWSKRDMAARTAIVLYTKNVEWLIEFGRLYRKVPPYPLPRRVRANAINSSILPSLNPMSILKAVTLEDFDLIGLDVALYASEKNPVGIRAFIDNKISSSGALIRESHEIFQCDGLDKGGNRSEVRRLSVHIEDSTWIVHNLTVLAQDIQARVCTPESGSRGEALVGIKHVFLMVGGGAESVPTHDNGMMKLHSPPAIAQSFKDLQISSPRSTSGENHERKVSTSILEFFDIPNDNPFCYRDFDNDAEEGKTGCEPEVPEVEAKPYQDEDTAHNEFRRLGFLLGLLSKEVRVTVSLTALETIVDIADSWVQVIMASLPELFDGTAKARPPIEPDIEEESVIVEATSSPKKFTSLAQDPKFSGLCLQGGKAAPRDESQQFEPTPYSNAETVRPSKRRSSVTVIQAKTRESAEDEQSPRSASSKLVHAFLMVKFEDCQVSFQDRVHKGSILFALNAGTLQHGVSSDSTHERVDLNVHGLQLFTAPLDVDVKSNAVWLKALADGSYCPSSYGLLKQVIAPIPARVTIWIDKEKILVKHKVTLAIPSIEVEINPMSKNILENLTTSATVMINAKVAEKRAPDHAHIIQSYLKEGKHQERSLQHLIALRKQLKWKIAALQRRQLSGWDYRMNERAAVAISAAESAQSLSFDIETSPLFRRRTMSSASVSSIMTNISMLGSTATHHYADENSTDELQSLTQQFESLYQLTRLLATEVQKQAQKNSLPNVDIEFTLDRASLMLSGETAGIVRAQVSSLSFQMQLFEDRSGKFALTLQDLSANNLNPGTPYPDLLVPAYSRSWEGDDMFLRIDAEIAKPVGNITVVQHFEVNVHPIQVCITQEVIMQLIGFFSPSTKLNGTKEEQREEVRSQFLQARTASGSSSDGRVGSAILKVVKGAGKAAAHPLSRGRTHRGDSDEEAASSFRKSKAGTLHNIAEDPSQWIAKLAASLSESEEASNIFGSPDELEQHVTFDPKSRAKNSILFKRIRLGAVEVLLTYKHKKSSTSTQHLHLPHAAQPQALEDMRGFEVKTRALVYCDKTCSPLDLLLRIRRDIVLDVLSQVGRNFTNIGNFLRDQFEPSRWAAFDALAPLKSLSTTVSSLGIGSSHTGAVVPLPTPPESESETPTKNSERHSSGSISTNVKPTESPYSSPRWEPPAHLVVSPRDQSSDSSAPSTPADASLAATHRPHSKPKLSLARMFSRRKSSSNPSPPPSQ